VGEFILSRPVGWRRSAALYPALLETEALTTFVRGEKKPLTADRGLATGETTFHFTRAPTGEHISGGVVPTSNAFFVSCFHAA
jgi:hypothetical protein